MKISFIYLFSASLGSPVSIPSGEIYGKVKESLSAQILNFCSFSEDTQRLEHRSLFRKLWMLFWGQSVHLCGSSPYIWYIKLIILYGFARLAVLYPHVTILLLLLLFLFD
jgi:hypothetical protein